MFFFNLFSRCELLWSDPQPQSGRAPSKRGVGVQFGPDVTENFLKLNGLDYIIRSHEVKNDGYEIGHDGKCITVFSAPNYCDTMGNRGAFITITGNNMSPKFTTYEAVVSLKFNLEILCFFFIKENKCSSFLFLILFFFFQPHPDIRPMQYARSLMKFMM